jgi:hypothetical protein
MFLIAVPAAFTFISGVGAAVAADSCPGHRLGLQRLGGGLVVIGAALMGLAFPLVV